MVPGVLLPPQNLTNSGRDVRLGVWAKPLNEEESRINTAATPAEFLGIQEPRDGNNLIRPRLFLLHRCEFNHIIVSRNGAFSGNRRMLINLVFGTGPEICKFLKDKRNAFGLRPSFHPSVENVDGDQSSCHDFRGEPGHLPGVHDHGLAP